MNSYEKQSLLITIAIPTYNRADSYLTHTMKSALEQTYENIEIIVSDNCSDDHTEELVKSYKDPRIRYYKQKENIGPINNMNFCLEKARGHYFLMVHDDDLLDSDIVEVCMNKIRHSPEYGLIRTGIRVINGTGDVIGESFNYAGEYEDNKLMQAWFESKAPIYVCNTMFNTKILSREGGFNSKKNMYPDVAALIKISANSKRADVIEPKCSFRRHAASEGALSKLQDWAEDSKYLIRLINHYFPDYERQVIIDGERFLCRMNYGRVGRLKPFHKKIIGMLRNYRDFGYVYSPVGYYYDKYFKARLRMTYLRDKLSLKISNNRL